MSNVPVVGFEVKQGLALVTLRNPDFNRLNRAVLNGLQEAVRRAGEPDVRALLLTGEGPVFSYGADVKDLFVDLPTTELLPVLRGYVELIQTIEALPIPTIAAVHGVCSSGGLELALAFDHLWASGGTKLGFMEASIGIPPLAGGVQRVAARAGRARALQIATAGKLFEADLFERWNIVGKVVDGASLKEEAEAFALQLASGPTIAYAAVKALLLKADAGGIVAADRHLFEIVAPALSSDDAQSAAKALVSGGGKLPAQTFKGR